MKLLVTGGAGFIGSNLVDKLIENGHEVVVVDNLSRGKKEQINNKAHFYEADIKEDKITDIFENEKPEAVFHLAAQIDLRKSVEDPVADAKTNILGSINIIKESQKTGVKKIIFSSTGGAIYGDASVIPTPEDYPAWPVSPYGVAKLAVEHYLYYYNKQFGLPYICLRYANVYGPRQDPEGEAGVIAIFTKKLLRAETPIIFGDGNQTRDYCFVEDVVSANILALESKETGTFNIGTGIETSVNDIASELKRITEAQKDAIHKEGKAGEQKVSCLDNSLAKNILGWEPKISLSVGLEKTVSFFIRS